MSFFKQNPEQGNADIANTRKESDLSSPSRRNFIIKTAEGAAKTLLVGGVIAKGVGGMLSYEDTQREKVFKTVSSDYGFTKADLETMRTAHQKITSLEEQYKGLTALTEDDFAQLEEWKRMNPGTDNRENVTHAEEGLTRVLVKGGDSDGFKKTILQSVVYSGSPKQFIDGVVQELEVKKISYYESIDTSLRLLGSLQTEQKFEDARTLKGFFYSK